VAIAKKKNRKKKNKTRDSAKKTGVNGDGHASVTRANRKRLIQKKKRGGEKSKIPGTRAAIRVELGRQLEIGEKRGD